MTFGETSSERFAVVALPESVGPAPHRPGLFLAEADPVEWQQ